MKAYNIQWDTDTTAIEESNLPNEVEIPDDIASTQDGEIISDWLSNTFGFCHFGFLLEDDAEYTR